MNEEQKRNAANQAGGMDMVKNWIRDNWNEETNLGKAKLFGLLALVFLLLVSFRETGEDGRETVTRNPQSTAQQHAEASLEEAGQQAAEVYKSYDKRLQEVVGEKQAVLTEAEQQAAAAYQGYEARIAELEQERQTLKKMLADDHSLDIESEQAARVYRDYEARVRELEAEQQALRVKLAEAGSMEEAAQQAAEAYDQYTSRVAELEHENVQLSGRLQALEADLASREEEISALRAELASSRELAREEVERNETLERVQDGLEELLNLLQQPAEQ